MDKIFQFDSDETNGRVVKILHDFLVSGTSKYAEMEEKERGAIPLVTIQRVLLNSIAGSKATNGVDDKVDFADLVGIRKTSLTPGVSHQMALN